MRRLPPWRWALLLTLLWGLPLLLVFAPSPQESLGAPCQTPLCRALLALVGGILCAVVLMALRDVNRPIVWGRALDGLTLEYPPLLQTPPEALSPEARAFQTRLRLAHHPTMYDEVLHDGHDGLVLQGLRGAPLPGRHVFVLCHFTLQPDSALFIGCLRAHLAQVAPNRWIYLVVCGAISDMEHSAAQWQPNRLRTTVTIEAIQRVDVATGDVRLATARFSPSKDVAAVVDSAVRDIRAETKPA